MCHHDNGLGSSDKPQTSPTNMPIYRNTPNGILNVFLYKVIQTQNQHIGCIHISDLNNVMSEERQKVCVCMFPSLLFIAQQFTSETYMMTNSSLIV